MKTRRSAGSPDLPQAWIDLVKHIERTKTTMDKKMGWDYN